MMVATSRILRVMPASKEKIVRWLKIEAVGTYDMVSTDNEIQVGFNSIDDAFRFRMQFDEELVG